MPIMNIRIASVSLGLILPLCTFAQGLHKEINVEQKIEPVKREAARINLLPSLQLPPVARPQLSFSDRVVTAHVPNTINTLDPVAFGDRLYVSPYRGYVALGLGAPLFNATFSAGYRAIDNDRTRLSLWSQYDGDIYTQTIPVTGGPSSSVKNYWRDHTASIGADIHQAVGKESFIDGGLDYTYAYHTVPIGHLSYGQNVSRVNARAIFSSHEDALEYSAGLRYRHFGFYHLSAPAGYKYIYDKAPYSTVRQNIFGASITTKLAASDESSIGLDVDADFLRTGKSLTPVYPFNDNMAVNGDKTTGLVSITPHYDYSASTVHARLGLQADLSVNDGKFFHIAPEVSLAWTPSQIVGFEVKAHGGSSLNSLSTLYDITPYISSFMTYGQSHIPYAFDGRITVGPFLGAYIEFFGGYAKANGWLMPTYVPATPGGAMFDRVDLSAWHFGAAIGYDYRKTLSARVSYETAPNDYDKSFYEWRDRAKHVVNAELKIRPIKPLLLSLDWEFRAGRRIYYTVVTDLDTSIPDHPLTIYTNEPTSLGCVSNLSLGAGFTVTDPLTIFARGENLLNRRFYHLGERYSQGTTFLIGASLKF